MPGCQGRLGSVCLGETRRAPGGSLGDRAELLAAVALQRLLGPVLWWEVGDEVQERAAILEPRSQFPD